MATIVEVSQPMLVPQSADLGSHDIVNQPTLDASKDKSADQQDGNNGDKSGKKDGKENGPKIFDNKTFVEAPIPKTNPWNKAAANNPAPVRPAPVPAATVTKPGENWKLQWKYK